MKKISLITLSFLSVMFLSYCSKKNDTTTTSSSTTNTTTGTAFTHSVKTIFDSKCASCHGSGGSASGKWLYNANNYETSIKAYLSTLHNVTSSTSAKMATASYGNLSQDEVNQLNAWYTAGGAATN